MKAWVDCEFCSFEDPEPLSLGWITERDDQVYIEIRRDESKCSRFVTRCVLPWLTSGGVTPELARKQIAYWIGQHGVTEFICDTSYDERILRDLGVTLPIKQVKQLPREEREKLFTHHALEDAKVLRSLYP